MGNIRLLVVDDDEMTRLGLRCIFETEGGIDIVGEAENGFAAIDMARQLRPDVVITDIDHPGWDGFEVLRRIREHDPEAKVLLFSGYSSSDWVDRSLALGARGYIVKGDDEPHMIVTGIKRVADGEPYFSRSLAPRFSAQ